MELGQIALPHILDSSRGARFGCKVGTFSIIAGGWSSPKRVRSQSYVCKPSELALVM